VAVSKDGLQYKFVISGTSKSRTLAARRRPAMNNRVRRAFGGSLRETHHLYTMQLMGIASLHPSYRAERRV
jgi:hypothetical protein